MNAITRWPLTWPEGWQRAKSREVAAFGVKRMGQYGMSLGKLSVADGTNRVLGELSALRATEIFISTNIQLRRDGLPRSDQGEPIDPGAAVYWLRRGKKQCMAIDRYTRVADNLAAIAATLEALRAIDRHGGGAILDRAFTGFIALPSPEQWFQVLGVHANASSDEIDGAWRVLAMKHHPDRPGGSTAEMARINAARDEGLRHVHA